MKSKMHLLKNTECTLFHVLAIAVALLLLTAKTHSQIRPARMQRTQNESPARGMGETAEEISIEKPLRFGLLRSPEKKDFKIQIPVPGKLTIQMETHSEVFMWYLIDEDGRLRNPIANSTKTGSYFPHGRSFGNSRQAISSTFSRSESQYVSSLCWNPQMNKASHKVTYYLDKGSFFIRCARDNEGDGRVSFDFNFVGNDGKSYPPLATPTWESIRGSNVEKIAVMTNLTLSTTSSNGATIKWKSSNPNLISNEGKVLRPSYANGDSDVTLEANVQKGDEEITEKFNLRVRALPITDTEAIDSAKTVITWPQIKGRNLSERFVENNLNLPESSSNDVKIKWESSPSGFIGTDGMLNRPSLAQGDKNIELTAVLHRGSLEEKVKFYLTVIAAPENDIEAIESVKATLWEKIKDSNEQASIRSKLNLLREGANGVKIAWSSTPDLIKEDGSIVRSLWSDSTVILKATIRRGTKEGICEYKLTIASEIRDWPVEKIIGSITPVVGLLLAIIVPMITVDDKDKVKRKKLTLLLFLLFFVLPLLIALFFFLR